MGVARLLGSLVMLTVGVVPGALLDQTDSGMLSALLSYLALGLSLALVVDTARTTTRKRGLFLLTLTVAVGASLLWALWSATSTMRLLAG